MSESLRAVPVAKDVWWVGAIDWGLADFHGYATGRGTTYNAYLVVDEKIALIDTVKAPFMDEMLARIASVVPPGDIDYIVSNHSEMDHSGGLPHAVEVIKPEKVFASAMGQRTLFEHFGAGLEVTPVNDNETLSLGSRRLRFIETRLLHWPDSMMSVLAPDNILFSQDGFGMHLASGARFADELDADVVLYEGAKYFANILLPYSPVVLKLLERVKSEGLEFSMIAPDHGPIWRKDVGTMPARYATWATQRPTAKVVITYDTMWQSTAAMARAIADGAAAESVAVTVLPLSVRHRSDVMTELLCAGALVVGSPTMFNHMYPTVADVLTYASGLRPKNLVGAAFGSYGWSGEGARDIQKQLVDMKLNVVGEPVVCRYVPNAEALARCREQGTLVAKRVRERAEVTDIAGA